MCHEANNTSRRFAEQGFSLIPALFMMVVLAGLGAVAVRLGGVQQHSVNLAIQGSRAYAAARAGIEWAAYEALNNSNCGTNSFALTEAGLNGFTVDTVCTSTTHAEGSGTTTVYSLQAFSRSGAYGTPDYVSRRMRATMTDAT